METQKEMLMLKLLSMLKYKIYTNNDHCMTVSQLNKNKKRNILEVNFVEVIYQNIVLEEYQIILY